MKSEEQIRGRLAEARLELALIEESFGVSHDNDYLESEIQTLEWVLGETQKAV